MHASPRTGTDDDLAGLWDLFRLAFGVDERRREESIARLDPARCCVVDGPRGEIAAASHIRPFHQWFGGRAVPLAGFSPVAVAAEHRRRGLGTLVTTAPLADLRDRGEVIAGLFPASLALYRGAGFELAGSYVERTVEARHLAALGRVAGGVEVRRGTVEDIGAVQRCQANLGASRDGSLRRDARWWAQILPEDLRATVLMVVEDPSRPGELRGYAIYGLAPEPGVYDYRVVVAEVLADDAEVARSLWSVVGSSGSQAPHVTVTGPAEDDLFLLVPQADPDAVRRELRWMLRLVDLPGAVAARGWPAHASGAVHLEVVDPHAPWNEGRWILEVEGGGARAVPGGRGDLRAGIGGLSSWWAGYATPEKLARTGHLAGTTEALSALGALLPAVPPVLPDFY